MFGENKASTFNKNLEKMIALVLFDKYEQGLSVTDIITEIKNKYALDFSDSEILNAIEHRHQRRIIQINEENNETLRKYSITPEEYQKIAKKTDDSAIRKIVSIFLEKYTEVDFSEEEFVNLLIKFLYDVFNSNADTILALMRGENSQIETTNYEYSIEEKESINNFIYWADPDKNRCVYQLISCCFDYCMMTVRKDKSVYRNIFNKKRFYLDTNIIFRLMGLNNKSRRMVIDAFISKCNEVGIQILVSNHTRNELNNTITNYVTQIKNTLQKSEPISVKAMSCLNDYLSKSDFYAEYVKWTKDPVNRVCDYSSFENDLKRKASEILSQFGQVSFDDFSSRRVINYQEQFDSLRNYKIERGKNFSDQSIKTDVNNYLYIQDQNNGRSGQDFFSVDHYLITADHAFSGWEREKRPGTIPTVVLPSVWYSIILQYAGRTTEDDYSSFTRFLNFSLSENETDDPRKMKILKYVLNLKEPTEIKEKTVFDISEKLQHEYKDLESEEIVEISHQYIVDQVLAEADEKAKIEKEAAIGLEQQKAEAQNRQLISEYSANLKNMEDKHRTEIDSLKAEKIRLEKKGQEDAETARLKEQKRLIDKETEKRTEKRIKIYKFITVMLILGFFGVLLWTENWIISVNKVTNKVQMQYDFIKYVIDIGYALCSGGIFGFVFKGLNEEKIKASICKKVEKEFS